MRKDYTKPEVSAVEEGLLEGVFACGSGTTEGASGNSGASNDINGGMNSIPATPLTPPSFHFPGSLKPGCGNSKPGHKPGRWW